MGGGCCGGGDHEPSCDLNPAKDRSTEFSLHTRIKWDEFRCLNEHREGAGAKVLRAWEDRLSDHYVESGCDGDLIFNIPFDGEVKLFGLLVVAPDDGSHPTAVRLFKGGYRDFDSVEGTPTQEVQLTPDAGGVIEYPLKTMHFSSVGHVALHFPANVSGSEETRVGYIGLRGEWKQVNRKPITIANYELQANPADHKTPWDQTSARHVM